MNCGTYKDRQFIDVLKKVNKKEKKLKATANSAKEAEKAAKGESRQGRIKKKGLDAAELSKK
jgi:hypothetical protein